jgi:hypothetical protein
MHVKPCKAHNSITTTDMGVSVSAVVPAISTHLSAASIFFEFSVVTSTTTYTPALSRVVQKWVISDVLGTTLRRNRKFNWPNAKDHKTKENTNRDCHVFWEHSRLSSDLNNYLRIG